MPKLVQTTFVHEVNVRQRRHAKRKFGVAIRMRDGKVSLSYDVHPYQHVATEGSPESNAKFRDSNPIGQSDIDIEHVYKLRPVDPVDSRRSDGH